MPSLHGGSLEITLTFPLPVFSVPYDTYFRCLFFEHFSITDFLFHFKNKEILVQLYLYLKQNPEMSPWTLNISPSFSLNYSWTTRSRFLNLSFIFSGSHRLVSHLWIYTQLITGLIHWNLNGGSSSLQPRLKVWQRLLLLLLL